MYYQESDGYLRKIKINVKDLSKIEKPKTLKLGDSLDIGIVNNSDTVSIDYAEITDTVLYKTKECIAGSCTGSEEELTASGYKILVLEFGTEVYTARKLLDFLNKYGKIVYIDSDGNQQEVKIESPISRKYYGKTVFLKLPNEVKENTKITLHLLIRNKEYNYEVN